MTASQMTAIEFQGALALLRWTSGQVAVWCGYSRQSGVYWEQGHHRTPPQVAEWIDKRLRGDLDDPPRRPPGPTKHRSENMASGTKS